MILTDERIKEIAKESLRSVDIHPSLWWFVADAIRQAVAESEIDAQARIEALEAALRRLIKSSEREAIAAESMRVASENFTDPNPEITAYEKACIESSEAVKQANAALDAARGA